MAVKKKSPELKVLEKMIDEEMVDVEMKLIDQLIEKIDLVNEKWKFLITGHFSFEEIFDLIKALVEAAEFVVCKPKSGVVKHTLVKDAFTILDKKYRIILRMDKMIPLPWFIEPFDGKILREIVDLLIIAVVHLLNLTIWKKEIATDE